MFRKASLLIIVLLICSAVLHAQEPEPMSDESWEVLKEFFEYDRNVPLNPEIIAAQEMEHCIRYKIVFSSIRNERVPCFLAIPKTGEGPFPLIVGCHGGYGSKDKFWDITTRHGFTDEVLKSGFAVLMIDALYHGDRIARNDYDDLGKILKEGRKYAFSDLLIHSVMDTRRALDYLATRNDIDMDRIGVYGHSMGGIMTFMLTAVDDRISAAVPCVGPPTYFTMTYPAYLVHYAARLSAQPVLMLYAKQDPTYTVEAAGYLFNNLSSSTKDIVWFDSGHSLPPEWSGETLRWFRTHLK